MRAGWNAFLYAGQRAAAAGSELTRCLHGPVRAEAILGAGTAGSRFNPLCSTVCLSSPAPAHPPSPIVRRTSVFLSFVLFTPSLVPFGKPPLLHSTPALAR